MCIDTTGMHSNDFHDWIAIGFEEMKTTRQRKALPYQRIYIFGKRLVLRPYKLSDHKPLQTSHNLRLQPVNKYDEPIPTAKEADRVKYGARLQRQRQNGKEGHHFIFGAFDKASGVFIGQIDLFTINQQLRWANIGYHIQNHCFGNGYATESVVLGLRIGFQVLGYHRIEAAMELDNKASRKVAQKSGLRFEGVREKFFPDNGGVDMNVFATNAIDFKKGRRRLERAKRRTE